MRRRAFINGAFYAVFIAALLVVGSGGAAAAESADAVTARLTARYASITTLTASFTQEFKAAGGGALSVSRGKVHLKKPGKMRWLYSDPPKDELVSDGRTISYYQADINQVMERPVPPTGKIASDLLSGVGEIKKEFRVRAATESEAGVKAAGGKSDILELTPRDEGAGFKRLFVAVDKESSFITLTIVEDLYGNRTSVGYSEIRTDEEIKDSFFNFKAPKGAAVLK